jgi:hypothetical protein
MLDCGTQSLIFAKLIFCIFVNIKSTIPPLKDKIFNALDDPVAVYHMSRLTENIGSIADHAENAGDMMRAIIAKKNMKPYS